MLPQIPEIQVAVKFIASCLYGKLPRRRADIFAEELSSAIQLKFQGHWYADQPTKGSAYRCLHFTSKEVDPVFNKASEAAGIAFSEISNNIPSELSVWVDPGEVSYQIGEKGTVSVLYRRNIMGQEEFGHDVANQSEVLMGADHKLYTVAEFMSTKFGSTKNRGQKARLQGQNQGHNQNHISPVQQPQLNNLHLYQQSQQLIRNQINTFNKQMQPTFAQQAFLNQQLLLQKLTMQSFQQLNQKALGLQQMKAKAQQFSRWHETNQMYTAQPELQLNMNSQGGFVPSFINQSNRSESNPSPKSESSTQSSAWSTSSGSIGFIGKDCWSVNQSHAGDGALNQSQSRWSPDLNSNPDWSSCDDSGLASNDDDLDLDPEIFEQIAALRIES